jgi:hypothetical protein
MLLQVLEKKVHQKARRNNSLLPLSPKHSVADQDSP